jgi:SNF2 family DNA or RNA helicase
MATAELVGGDIVVRIRPRELHLVQQVPGAHFHTRADRHGDGDHFQFPCTWAACLGLRGVFGDRLEVGPELAAWSVAERDGRVMPALELRGADDARLPRGFGDLSERLRPDQRADAMFLTVAGSAILGLEMRLGKTVTASAALALLRRDHAAERGVGPVLVVCPNSVKFEWARHLREWADMSAVVVTGTPTRRARAIEAAGAGEYDAAVINWEALRYHTRLEAFGSSVRVEPKEKVPKELNAVPWSVVIADEAHRAAQPRSKQTRALWAAAKDAEVRWALTGTPADEVPIEDIWALGHFVAPAEYPSKTAHLDRYALMAMNYFSGFNEPIGVRPDTQDELFGFLDPRFARRTRASLGWDEPTYETRTVELAPKQRKAYESMRKEMIANGIIAANPLVQTTRLRQFAAATCSLDADGEVQMTEPSSKIDALMDVVEELSGEPAIVYSESRKLIELAGARLDRAKVDHLFLVGDDAERQDDAVRAFQQGDGQLILSTIAEGVTLSRANTEVFLMRSYSRKKQRQAEARGISDKSAVHIIDVIAKDTIEEQVQGRLGEKADLAEEINRDASLLAELLGEA